ncbi:MAG: 2'-5' RNA ligase family protein [Saprospiraceae bacterium]|nr:2'-5' RNA ligase family protein [Saprospiraceae bacterium]
MTRQTRKQITLFIEPEIARTIERVRQKYNPVQYALIDSHVTLCREDEIVQFEQVLTNIRKQRFKSIFIDFGPVVRFSEGKGVMIPESGENESFHALRQAVLAGIDACTRLLAPHITLMHPRNATCTDEIFADMESEIFPKRILFRKISVIEQYGTDPWQILYESDTV